MIRSHKLLNHTPSGTRLYSIKYIYLSRGFGWPCALSPGPWDLRRWIKLLPNQICPVTWMHDFSGLKINTEFQTSFADSWIWSLLITSSGKTRPAVGHNKTRPPERNPVLRVQLTCRAAHPAWRRLTHIIGFFVPMWSFLPENKRKALFFFLNCIYNVNNNNMSLNSFCFGNKLF